MVGNFNPTVINKEEFLIFPFPSRKKEQAHRNMQLFYFCAYGMNNILNTLGKVYIASLNESRVKLRTP